MCFPLTVTHTSAIPGRHGGSEWPSKHKSPANLDGLNTQGGRRHSDGVMENIQLRHRYGQNLHKAIFNGKETENANDSRSNGKAQTQDVLPQGRWDESEAKDRYR
jgi:hypothetical protein